jgi:RNA polymerase sigma-70 factor (ECF subfamily)
MAIMKPRSDSKSESRFRTRHSLIERVRNPNDAKAWGEFWVYYEELFKRYMRRMHLRDQDVDDLTPDLYPKLRAMMPSFQYDPAKGQFRGWLRRITDNMVRDWLRAQKRQHDRQEDLGQYLAAVKKSMEETPEADSARELEWMRNVAALVLEKAKEEFKDKPKTWACFVGNALEKRPAKEVAAELGIEKVNNVYVYSLRVLRRVQELRADFAEYDGEVTPDPSDTSAR